MVKGSMMLVRAAVLLTLFGVLCFAPPAAAQRSHDLFSEGVERYRSGDYVEAQRLLREYVQAFGDRGGPEAGKLGEAYHYLGLMTPDAKLAEGYFLAVAQRYPTSTFADEAMARLGQLYRVQANLPEARKQWRTLARDYPLSRFLPEVELRVGETYFTEGDWENAYKAFSTGFSRMKDYQRKASRGANLRELEGEYAYWIGRTMLARRARGDARKYLNLVTLDYPTHPLEPLALYYLAESYREDGKEREAQEAWRRFSESVRNTSLESVAENPNLLAVALAREAGTLDRPRETAASGAPGAEPRERAPSDSADAALREEAAPRVGGPGDLAAPRKEEGLRGPEPGRPGGVVADEPLGRRVEEPTPPRETDREVREKTARDRAVLNQIERKQEAPEGVAGDSAAAREAAGGRPEARAELETGEAVVAPADKAPAPAQVAEERRGAAAKPTSRQSREEAKVSEARTPGPSERRDAPRAETGARAETAAGAGGEPGARGDRAGAAQGAVADAEEGPIYIQVGAFTSAESAGELSGKLRKKRFEPAIHTGLVNGQGYYRVRFGPFELPREQTRLESTRAALLQAGFPSILMRDDRAR